MKKNLLSAVLTAGFVGFSLPAMAVPVSAEIEIIDYTTVEPEKETAWETSGYCGRRNNDHSGEFGDNISWVLDENGTLTISGSGFMYDFEFQTYTGGGGGGNPSPWIRNPAIKELVIEDGVLSIGTCAFSMCENLASISIPESVVVIGAEAFLGTEWLNNQPDGMVYINNCAYELKGETTEDSDVTIVDDTTYISDLCFESYYDTGEDYGWYVYNDIDKILPIIPDTIYDLSFLEYCDGFYDWWEQLSDGFIIINHCILGYKGDTSGVTELIIPNDIIGISEYALAGFESVESVIIPESVKYIGCNSFANWSSLSSVTIENPDCIICDLDSSPIYNNSDEGEYAPWDCMHFYDGTIYGYDNSTARAYAAKFGYTFVALDAEETESSATETSSDSSDSASTAVTPPQTGDTGIALALAGLLTAAGAAFVLRKKD